MPNYSVADTRAGTLMSFKRRKHAVDHALKIVGGDEYRDVIMDQLKRSSVCLMCMGQLVVWGPHPENQIQWLKWHKFARKYDSLGNLKDR